MKIVFLGLSVTSSWGNGHATTYRGLMRGLAARGHDVVFLERDVPWYSANRDLRHPPYGRTELYSSLEELRDVYTKEISEADAAIVGSYVPEGVAVGEWVVRTASSVTAFYDIDTPVTLAKLERGDFEYLSPELAGQYHLYLSFTGGPTLNRIQRLYGAPRPRALYCSVDPDVYYPEEYAWEWDLGYLGTYSDDRQPALERMLIQTARDAPARRFAVAGPQYPESIDWPRNVQRIEHLPPQDHRRFYNSQRFTLNVTRQAMVQAGWSPSVRLFEAAACGVPIVSDYWRGLESFFTPGREVILEDAAGSIRDLPDRERRNIGLRARAVVLERHTAACRAAELENYIKQVKRNDQISSHSARRNGHGGQASDWPDAGRPAEQYRPPAGGTTGVAPRNSETERDLFEPSRTGAADRGTAGSPAVPRTGRLDNSRRTRLRRVDGPQL